MDHMTPPLIGGMHTIAKRRCIPLLDHDHARCCYINLGGIKALFLKFDGTITTLPLEML